MVKAFPSAFGYGTGSNGVTENIGGRGGTVLFIDNLNDSGPGSAREAFEASFPRYVLPRTHGAIELLSDLRITNPYMTFAGQVAPGGGIYFRNYNITIESTHDIILRHLRSYTGQGAIPPQGRDTNPILIYGTAGPCYNVTLDHCSALWSTDECLTVYADFYNITVQWCLIAEPNNQGHSGGGPHALGSLVGTGVSYTGRFHTVSLHHNAWHTCAGRIPLVNPYVLPNASIPYLRADIRNNVMYNWLGNNYLQFGRAMYTVHDWNSFVSTHGVSAIAVEGNVVKNVLIKGGIGSPDNHGMWTMPNVKTYLSQNIGPASASPVDGFALGVQRINKLYEGHVPSPFFNAPGEYDPTAQEALSPYGAPAIPETDPLALVSEVAAEAGATMPMKDSTHIRIMDELLNQTAGPIVETTPESAYPSIASGTYPTHSQPDGIPDAWKLANGLNVGTDYTGVMAPSGYDWVEEYINGEGGDTPPPPASPPSISVPTLSVVTRDVPKEIVVTVSDVDNDLASVRVTVDQGKLTVTPIGGASVN